MLQDYICIKSNCKESAVTEDKWVVAWRQGLLSRWDDKEAQGNFGGDRYIHKLDYR